MKRFLSSIFFKAIVIALFTLGLTTLVERLLETSFMRTVFPETIALEQFDFTDFVFRSRETAADTNIVLVNIGELDRGQIAQQVEIINRYQPKVIAFDIIFSIPDSSHLFESQTQKLVKALRKCMNVVLLTQIADLSDSSSKVERSVLSDYTPQFEGFANLKGDSWHLGLEKVRRFRPSVELDGKRYFSFGAKIAHAYDSVTSAKLFSRGLQSEIINFRGNILDWNSLSRHPGQFMVLDWGQALDTTSFDGRMFGGKIVIFGNLGETLLDTNFSDRYVTPLNPNVIGLAVPDMYSPVIHANIVSMILNGDFIDESSNFTSLSITFFVCFLHVLLLLWIHEKFPVWFDLASISFIIIQSIFFSLIRLFVFDWFNYKINLNTTLGSLTLASIALSVYYLGLNLFKTRLVEASKEHVE